MTITTTSSKVVCAGNGSTIIFNYSFLIPEASDAVIVYTDANGNETTLTGSQYTITGLGNDAGGTVQYPLSGSPIANGTSLTIQRIVPYTQEVVIDNQGAFYPAVIEGALDNTVMQIQQLATDEGRALKQPVSDSSPIGDLPGAAQRANYYLGFDADGNPVPAAGGAGSIISPAMVPVVSAQTLAAALVALFADLPTDEPASAGVWWLNGGVLSKS